MRSIDMVRAAKRDGADAGKCAAGWAFDGNTTDETYRVALAGINDGDPAVLDVFNVPNLSGEWADGPTPHSLAEDYDLSPERDPDGWRLDEVCSTWEDAAGKAFWAEIERVCLFHTSEG